MIATYCGSWENPCQKRLTDGSNITLYRNGPKITQLHQKPTADPANISKRATKRYTAETLQENHLHLIAVLPDISRTPDKAHLKDR